MMNRTRLTLATIGGLVLTQQLAEGVVSGDGAGFLRDWVSNLFELGLPMTLFGAIGGIVVTLASTGLRPWLARGHVGVLWERLLLFSAVGAGLFVICHPMSLFTIGAAWANSGSIVTGLRYAGGIFGFGFIPGLLFGAVFCLLSWSIRKWPRVKAPAVVLLVGFCVIGLAALVGQFPYGLVHRTGIDKEQNTLSEGHYMTRSLFFPSARSADVTVTASPRPVNVMLMDNSQYEQYVKVRGYPPGNRSTYEPQPSRIAILQMRERAVLPAGLWWVVVERPIDSSLGSGDTTVTIAIEFVESERRQRN